MLSLKCAKSFIAIGPETTNHYGNGKSDNNNKKNNVDCVWRPVSGSKNDRTDGNEIKSNIIILIMEKRKKTSVIHTARKET